MKIRFIGLSIIVLLSIVGCNSSKKTSSWLASDREIKKPVKLLLLGLVPYPNIDKREQVEIKMEQDFQHEGVNAVASLRLLGVTVFERMDEEDALYQLNNNCVDAVLTVTLLSRQKEALYKPGLDHYTPFSYYYDRFWRYRTTMQARTTQPGYFNDFNSVFLECNLYDMITQKLVYSAQSGSFDISNPDKQVDKMIRTIVKYLARQSKTGPRN